MAYKDKEKERDYQKAYQKAHMEEHKARMKAWYNKHKEEQNAKMKAWYNKHKEEQKAKMKAWYNKHKEEHKARTKAYSQAHKEERNAYNKDYNKSDTNSLGKTKNSVRNMSSYYLFNTLKHTRLKGYEIHHCFGYEDHRNFIYIPKELHLQIHQYLRDNGIDADTDHYNQIAQLIINYIKCNEKHILILKQSQ